MAAAAEVASHGVGYREVAAQAGGQFAVGISLNDAAERHALD